jgi:FkbM family methyltransferase
MKPDEEYAEAARDLSAGRFAAAADRLERVVLRSPRAAQSLYLLGVARLLEGRLDEARAIIDRAFEVKRWIKDLPATTADLGPAAGVAAALLPEWQWPRYEIERQAFASVGMTLDWVTRRWLSSADVFFVQVGANDGSSAKDPVHRLIENNRWSGVCIEPTPVAFAKLQATYQDNPRVTTANVAIDEQDSTREMYLPADADTTLASFLPDRNIMAKYDELQTLEVTCRTFGSLFDALDVKSVDLLQIDTEGYDYQILRMFDLAGYRPSVVNMEMFCLPIDERLATFGLLRQAGYAYRYDGKDLIAVDRDRFDEALCIVDRTNGHWLVDGGAPRPGPPDPSPSGKAVETPVQPREPIA